jgi:predicted amidohydrolase
VLAEGDDGEQLLVAEIDLRQVQAARRHIPVYDDRRPEAYHTTAA